MKQIVNRYTAASFYSLVLLVSGALVAVQMLFPQTSAYSLSLPQLAPTLSVAIICLFHGNKEPFKNIKSKLLPRKADIAWIPLTISLAIAVVGVSAALLSWMGTPYQRWNGTVVPIIVMLVGCSFEEIGWRGFLLPHLERKYSPFISTLIVGFLWGFWHMSFNLGILGFLIFIMTAIEMSIIMTWIYHKTNGNLLLMTLWHTVINVSNQVFLTGRLTASGFAMFAMVLAIVCGILLVTNRKLFFGRTVCAHSNSCL